MEIRHIDYLKDTRILSKPGIILNLPFTIVEKKDTLWK